MKKSLVIAMFALLFTSLPMSAGKTITVKNAKDFIKALGSDRTIVISSSKPLNITDALEDMIAKGEIAEGETYYGMSEGFASGENNVTFASNTDGNGLQVRNCHNLTIKGKGKAATLLASPRYVNVIEFFDCSDITMENVIMGHTNGGYCDKGVIEFSGCNNVLMNDCDMFGCGTEGIVLNQSNRVTVNRSVIHDCTYHTMHVRDCRQVRFNDCIFRNNMEFDQINIGNTKDIVFTGCVFDSLDGPLFNMDDYHYFYSCAFRNCALEPVRYDWYTQGNAILVFCTYQTGGEPLTTAHAMKPTLQEGIWTDGAKTYTVSKADDYRYVFASTDEEDVFAINAVSVPKNEYMTNDEWPYENHLGHLSVSVKRIEGQDFVQILDDGHQLIKSFYFLRKK